LSVSNGFVKIELAKPNGEPGRYFFTRFFSSRRPLRRVGSLARSPARCVALLPPSIRASAFASRKKVGDGVLQAARVHLALIEGRPEEVGVLGDREPAGWPWGESFARRGVSPIWREEESETCGRPKTAREERPIGLCQVV
jgi:hypothetical protein